MNKILFFKLFVDNARKLSLRANLQQNFMTRDHWNPHYVTGQNNWRPSHYALQGQRKVQWMKQLCGVLHGRKGKCFMIYWISSSPPSKLKVHSICAKRKLKKHECSLMRHVNVICACCFGPRSNAFLVFVVVVLMQE